MCLREALRGGFLRKERFLTMRPRILVVGSLVMDMISSTQVFPKEGQTVLGQSFATAPGGKGANQAVEASLLGADVTMVGKVGQDAFGDGLIASLDKAGVNTSKVMRAPEGTASGCASITLTKDESGRALNNRIIVIPGANMAITPDDIAYLREEIGSYDMVILQLEIPTEIDQLVASYAKEKGVPVMLNPAPIAPIPADLMANITYLSPNETEAAGLLGCFIRNEGEPVTEEALLGIRSAMASKGLEKLLITLGDEGAMVIDGGQVTRRPACEGIRAVDPTAAGDSFVGAFCTARCVGLEEGDAITFANMIAAVTVSGMGAQPSLPTLERAIAFHREGGRDTQILERVKALIEGA